MTAHLRRTTMPEVSAGAVDRAMRTLGLEGVRRAKGVRTTIQAKDGYRAGDLLDGDFSASAPNRKWVTDFTHRHRIRHRRLGRLVEQPQAPQQPRNDPPDRVRTSPTTPLSTQSRNPYESGTKAGAVQEFDRVYRVNLRGALVVSQVAIGHMLEFGYGRIVHLASIAGKEGNPNMIGYSATKAGLIGMVKAQGKEYAGTGVTVNAIAPAVIRTDLVDALPDEVVEYMVAKIPMGRTGTLDEAAAMVRFVASPQCGFTTGFTFDLSGGRATY